MAGRVAGKVAFITGAGHGMGRSHAIRLAEEGADIIAVDICKNYETVTYDMATEEELAETARMVGALGRRVVSRVVDVRNGEGLKTALDEGVAELGKLDIVVANAAIGMMNAWDDISRQLWQDIIDTNLTGVWNTLSAGAPHLIANGGGSMIAISSAAGLKGLPFLAPYVAAKHGVVGLARSLGNELGKFKVRVNTVHPTGAKTPMGFGAGRDSVDRLLQQRPDLAAIFQNTLPAEQIEPEDVSNAVLYLASDESQWVTGLALTVDAGQTIR